jgi:hypothetical protein
MPHVIDVRPESDGWSVEGGVPRTRKVFQSAAAAELSAKALAEQLAASGDSAQIRLYLRNGQLGARLHCPSQTLEWALEPAA